MPDPLVAVVMGSKSDAPLMDECLEMLSKLGIPHESAVMSAHRTPDKVREFAIGARDRGIEVIERAILPEELARTQEIFITGTAAEVTPVGEIDGQAFTVGEVTQELMTAYSDLVRNHQKASASAA